MSAVALLAIRFLPLQSWMVPTAYAIPALLALPEHAIQAYEGFRRGERLNDELIICLTALLLFAVRLYTESVLLLLFTFLVSLLENKLYKKCVPVHEKVSALLPNTVSVLTEEGTEQSGILTRCSPEKSSLSPPESGFRWTA